MTVPLELAAKQRHRCLDGHPWVFRSELTSIPADLPDGALVQITERGRPVGAGFYGRKSQIAVRLLTRGSSLPDDDLLLRRLDEAIAHRASAMAGRPAHRLVSSEGDRLPGLIVDRYGDRLVVQTTTAAMDVRFAWWIDRLRERLQPQQIVERNDLAVRKLEGLGERSGVVFGPADATVNVRVGALDTRIDLLDPHKTGSYLDQQLNHEGVARFVQPGDHVLDVFCHLGGFALHALAAGAGSAVAVDQSEASVSGAIAAAEAHGFASRFTAHRADAFTWLREAVANGTRFDVVVLDPPTFTRNREALPAALRAYRDLHRLGLSLLKPQGRLLTFSCSHHVDEAAFAATLAEAASTRALRIDGRFSQAPDHPVLLGVPETLYLKGIAVTALAH